MHGSRPIRYWRTSLAEFTGERVIPGQVDIDLLNEHVARYTFAARLARGKRVLDAGCGAGYGSAELAHEAEQVTGIDRDAGALDYARANYPMANLAFEQASCESLPYDSGRFDLVVAFEVIEHLEDWRGFLAETRRVLSPGGQFVVSTPNKDYYTESRGAQGANPFHVHEFGFDEFRSELLAVFPHVALFLENHVEGVTFQPFDPSNTTDVRVDAAEPDPAGSHFFLAVCAHRPQIGNPTFVYIPRAANVLREREHHIALLERELATKNEWLERALREHESLMAQFDEQKQALERSNQWAATQNVEIQQDRARIVELQDEMAREQANAATAVAAYESQIAGLEQDVLDKTKWARDMETEVGRQTADLVKAVDALHHTEAELEARTEWALRLQKESEALAQQLALVRGSRWVKLGRKVGLGPVLPG
jgi:SAM-dependent methyltransferase